MTKGVLCKTQFGKENSQKGILDITPAIEDSIGNDPIIVRDAWVSKNQLLNIELRYLEIMRCISLTW
jgi:hypothetical protein